MQDHFVHEDTLSGRRRLGPLGWVALGIAVLFVLAMAAGAYAFLTRNVASLNPQAHATQVAVVATATAEAATQAAPSATPRPPTATATATGLAAILTPLATRPGTAIPALAAKPMTAPAPAVAATQPITWTVWAVKDPEKQADQGILYGAWMAKMVTSMHGQVYDGPPEIKQWVLRTIAEDDAIYKKYLCNREVLFAQLANYRLEPYLSVIRDTYDQRVREGQLFISQPRNVAPKDKPLVVSFTPEGRGAYVAVFSAKSKTYYNPKTCAVIKTADGLSQDSVYLMLLDQTAGRWMRKELIFSYVPENNSAGVVPGY